MPLYPAEGLKHFWRTQPEEDLGFEELLPEISARLISLAADQVDTGIEEALRLICNSAGIDESTIYLREIENPDIFVLNYVLRDPALPPPPTRKFTAADNFPWCNKKLIANEIIYLPDTQAAPEEAAVDKASWKKYNVVSALVIPLSTGGGRPLGFWGIDSTSERREWPEWLQKRLRIIAGVFASTIERAVSDRLLRASEARLTLAAETAGAGFWTIDVETGVIWATAKLKALFGFKPDDAIDMPIFLAAVHSEDRQSVQEAIDAMRRGEERQVEYRIVPSTGTMHWVMSRGSLRVFAADARSVLMGITFDTTERKRAEEALADMTRKFIESQEQERSRIGRELHDDINQRLALLNVELEQLQDNPSEVGIRVQELRKQVTDISKDVQALSHDLHSSQLNYLGAVPGMKSWCKEFSERQGMQIDCRLHVQSTLPPEIGLCLFRVLQEALHNAAKHSGVKRIEVELSEDSGGIHLTVRDLGKGFDVEAVKQGKGLGLTSMRERIRLVNGTIAIDSRLNGGTTLRVRIPLESHKNFEREAI
jgi:PAS domain S-box-containing protein